MKGAGSAGPACYNPHMQPTGRSGLWAALLAGALALSAQVLAGAQRALVVHISPPDTRQFPVVHVFASISDEGGRRLAGLPGGSFQVLEDEAVIVSPQVREVVLGTRQVFALNTTSGMALRDASGRTRDQLVREALQQWWQSPGAGMLGVDDLTLLTGSGLLAEHTDSAAELAARLDQPPTASENTLADLDLVLRALDFLSDPAPRPGMPGYLIFLTPLLEPGHDLSLVNAIARANETGTTIYPVLVGPPEAATLAQAASLQQLAEGTGGTLFLFDPAEGLRALADQVLDQRTQYQISYTSGVNLSGTHTVRLRLTVDGAEATTEAREYDITIQPPEAVFLDPPAQVERRSDDPTLTVEELPPTSLPLRLLITFPDGHPRPLAGSELIVDGRTVLQRLEAPFDVLEWDLRGAQISGSHQIRAVVSDSLGLEGVTADLAIRVNVIEPPRGLAALRNASGPLLIALAILALGMVAAVGLSARWRTRQPGEGAMPGPGRRTPLRRAGLQPRPTAEQAEAYLLPIDPKGGPVEAYPLSGAEVVLGRDASLCTLALEDASLNGMHARLIRMADGGYQIRDLGSVAGTRVNFRPISPEGTRLEHGDRIDLGRSSLRFQLSDPPPPRQVHVRPVTPPAPTRGLPEARPAHRPRRARLDPQEPSRDPDG